MIFVFLSALSSHFKEIFCRKFIIDNAVMPFLQEIFEKAFGDLFEKFLVELILYIYGKFCEFPEFLAFLKIINDFLKDFTFFCYYLIINYILPSIKIIYRVSTNQLELGLKLIEMFWQSFNPTNWNFIACFDEKNLPEYLYKLFEIALYVNIFVIFDSILNFNRSIFKLRIISIRLTNIILLLSLNFVFFLDNFMVCDTANTFIIKIYNIYNQILIDGLAYSFLLITTFLIPLCILISWESFKYRLKELILLLLLIEYLLIKAFLTSDLILFYIYFESILLPTIALIGIFGTRYS